jgi:hypothetical protein
MPGDRDDRPVSTPHPTHRLRSLETPVRPGPVSVQSGYRLATNAKKATRSKKLNSLQLIDSE